MNGLKNEERKRKIDRNANNGQKNVGVHEKVFLK